MFSWGLLMTTWVYLGVPAAVNPSLLSLSLPGNAQEPLYALRDQSPVRVYHPGPARASWGFLVRSWVDWGGQGGQMFAADFRSVI